MSRSNSEKKTIYNNVAEDDPRHATRQAILGYVLFCLDVKKDYKDGIFNTGEEDFSPAANNSCPFNLAYLRKFL